MAEDQSDNQSQAQEHQDDTVTSPAPKEPEQRSRSYSEDDVNRIVKDRLARERAKHADYDDVKRRAGEADTLQSELEKSKAETAELRAKVEQAEHEQKIAGIRSTVAAKYGIADPTILMVGDDEEQIDAYAQKLMQVFRPYARLDQARSTEASGKIPRDNAKDFAEAMAKAGY
ncbi:scaffolding protein [Bifidobacterium parmae]|uniref:Scaffold protein n=1 Tax=Bifidobacterium parmae TaxID=361854 RepID=A0A2N5IWC3_9BIFI|nr:scaffolding protein [Bifidobacterium parmae]PLS26247.1 scaffold protein [Bifidobacterium parmae]